MRRKKPQKKKKPRQVKEKLKQIKIKVVGIGGGGNSIVADIASKMKGVRFVAANTDSRALRRLGKKVKCFQFGQDLTEGMGTGMDIELGRKGAQKEEKKIRRLLKGYDFCIFVSCLGGGTGSGATPVFAKISKDLGNVNFGFFTLPFGFEGEKKTSIAKDTLGRLRPFLHAFSIIPNDRIFKIVDQKTPLKSALAAINERLSMSLEGLIGMIRKPGLINIDFADLKTIMKQKKKLAFLNKTEFRKGSQKKIEELIFSPLYPYNIKGAKGLLFNIVSGNKLGIGEINEISRGLQKLVGRRAKIIFGIRQERDLKDKIALTLLATGCNSKEEVFPKTIKKTKRRKPKRRKKLKRTIKAKSPVKPLTTKKVKPLPLKTADDEEKEKEKIRRNALQISRELEIEERERLEKEKVLEVPAILRRKKQQYKI